MKNVFFFNLWATDDFHRDEETAAWKQAPAVWFNTGGLQQPAAVVQYPLWLTPKCLELRVRAVRNGAGKGLCINRWLETNKTRQDVQNTVSQEVPLKHHSWWFKAPRDLTPMPSILTDLKFSSQRNGMVKKLLCVPGSRLESSVPKSINKDKGFAKKKKKITFILFNKFNYRLSTDTSPTWFGVKGVRNRASDL